MFGGGGVGMDEAMKNKEGRFGVGPLESNNVD